MARISAQLCHAQVSPMTCSPNLWNDDVSQRFRQPVDLHGVIQLKRAVVLHVVFDAVVDVWDLTDVVASIFHLEVLLQFGPATQHQLQSLAVVQLDVCMRKSERDRAIALAG